MTVLKRSRERSQCFGVRSRLGNPCPAVCSAILMSALPGFIQSVRPGYASLRFHVLRDNS